MQLGELRELRELGKELGCQYNVNGALSSSFVGSRQEPQLCVVRHDGGSLLLPSLRSRCGFG